MEEKKLGVRKMKEFKIVEPTKGLELVIREVERKELVIPQFQREVSTLHLKRLEKSIIKLGFLTLPVVAKDSEGNLLVIDGQHRILALDNLKGKNYKLWVLEIPKEVAHHILDFNIEKPPTIRDKAKQVYELLKPHLQNPETEITELELAGYIEEPYLLTIGIGVKEVNPRMLIFKKLIKWDKEFMDLALPEVYKIRRSWAEQLNQIGEYLREQLANENYLSYEKIVDIAFKELYGERVRKIEDDFSTFLQKIMDYLPNAIRKWEMIYRNEQQNSQLQNTNVFGTESLNSYVRVQNQKLNGKFINNHSDLDDIL